MPHHKQFYEKLPCLFSSYSSSYISFINLNDSPHLPYQITVFHRSPDSIGQIPSCFICTNLVSFLATTSWSFNAFGTAQFFEIGMTFFWILEIFAELRDICHFSVSCNFPIDRRLCVCYIYRCESHARSYWIGWRKKDRRSLSHNRLSFLDLTERTGFEPVKGGLSTLDRL